MLSIPIRLLAYFIRIFIIFHAYLLVTISLLKFSSASLETRIIFMTVKVAELLVGVATLSLMPALWNVVILLHETASQGEPFGFEIKTFTSKDYV